MHPSANGWRRVNRVLWTVVVISYGWVLMQILAPAFNDPGRYGVRTKIVVPIGALTRPEVGTAVTATAVFFLALVAYLNFFVFRWRAPGASLPWELRVDNTLRLALPSTLLALVSSVLLTIATESRWGATGGIVAGALTLPSTLAHPLWLRRFLRALHFLAKNGLGDAAFATIRSMLQVYARAEGDGDAIDERTRLCALAAERLDALGQTARAHEVRNMFI